MANWVPISGSALQFSKNADGAAAADYYLKFYAAGTTTAISMATTSSGVTTLDKCKVDSNGWAVNGSDDPFIPHIDRDYKLVLYANSADADSNATGSAAWVIDNLSAEGLDKTYTSVAALRDSTGNDSFNVIEIESYYEITYPSTAGPKGGHKRHRTGGTNTSPTVGSPVAVSTIGTGTQAGYVWDGDGVEWAVSVVDYNIDTSWFGAGLGAGDDAPMLRDAYIYAKNSNLVTTITGYSDNYQLDTQLVLGDADTPAIVANIEILGNFTTAPALASAIIIRGFKESDISIGYFQASSDSSNTGVIIENCFKGTITIQGVENYVTPLNFLGDGTYGAGGCAYTQVVVQKAGEAAHTADVLQFNTQNVGYINSMDITVNDARGDKFARHIKGVGQTDPYNRNIYRVGGLEAIATIGYDFAFTQYCTVLYPRLENPGANFATGIVVEASDCFSNTYHFNTLPISKIGTLNTGSIIQASLLDSGSNDVAYQAQQTAEGLVFLSNRARDATIQPRTVFTSGNTFATSTGKGLRKYRGFVSDPDGTIHPYGTLSPHNQLRITSYTGGDTVNLDYATLVDITVDSGALTLLANSNRELNGFSFLINLRVAMSDLTIDGSDAVQDVAATALSTAGLYACVFLDSRWRVSQIGSALAIS